MSQKRKYVKVTKYFEMPENENGILPNVQDGAMVILRKNVIAVKVYIRWEKQSHINDLNLHLKKLKKEEWGSMPK